MSYRFDRPGARVLVDGQDRASLSTIPLLRQVIGRTGERCASACGGLRRGGRPCEPLHIHYSSIAKRKYRFTPTTAFIPRVVEHREVSSRPGTLGGDGEKRRS
jgi:hypothetical protein